MVRWSLVLVSVFVLGAASYRQANADIIGIGLDWRKNIFVQEYWSEGKPFYAIANKTDADQTIVCRAYRGQAKLAGPWKAPAQSVVHVDATPLLGKDLVQFDLESGESLGLLAGVASPNELPKAPVVSFDGLNGSGGRHVDIWVEQNAKAYASGDLVELRVKIPNSAGELLVKKGDLAKIEVACDTLKVVPAKNGGSTLDFAHPIKAEETHTIVLKFPAPEVKHPTMLTVDSWLWARGKRGGHGITRGVVIEPK